MKVARSSPPPALLAAAGLWLGLPVAAPIAAAGGWAPSGWIYLFFSPVCHQNPERSFFLLDHQLAVCHRCFGLYLGLVLGLALLPGLVRLRDALSARPMLIVWFAVPMMVDVVLPFDIWASRFATGIVAGFPVALVLWLASDELLGSHPTREGGT